MHLILFDARKWENRKLGEAMDQIRNKYEYSRCLPGDSEDGNVNRYCQDEADCGHKK